MDDPIYFVLSRYLSQFLQPQAELDLRSGEGTNVIGGEVLPLLVRVK